MPNWCENYLRLEVPNKQEADKIVAVLDSDKDDVGLLNHLMPQPENNPDWYSWRVNNWGTKWDICNEHYERDDNDDGSVTFNINFDSAWGPPVGVYDCVSEKDGWNVFATYIEGGMAFGGYHEEGQDYSFELGSRDATDAPAWWVDDHSWYYDQQEEWEQEEDAESVKTGVMTHDEFIVKWGVENYNIWAEHMKKDEVKNVQ